MQKKCQNWRFSASKTGKILGNWPRTSSVIFFKNQGFLKVFSSVQKFRHGLFWGVVLMGEFRFKQKKHMGNRVNARFLSFLEKRVFCQLYRLSFSNLENKRHPKNRLYSVSLGRPFKKGQKNAFFAKKPRFWPVFGLFFHPKSIIFVIFSIRNRSIYPPKPDRKWTPNLVQKSAQTDNFSIQFYKKNRSKKRWKIHRKLLQKTLIFSSKNRHFFIKKIIKKMIKKMTKKCAKNCSKIDHFFVKKSIKFWSKKCIKKRRKTDAKTAPKLVKNSSKIDKISIKKRIKFIIKK